MQFNNVLATVAAAWAPNVAIDFCNGRFLLKSLSYFALLLMIHGKFNFHRLRSPNKV